MKRSGPGWLDALIAGLLLVLTGREVLDELRGHHAPDGAPASAGSDTRPLDGRAPHGRLGDRATGAGTPALPPGIELPRPSVWPVVLGGGLSLVLFGIVTSYLFMLIGVLLMVGALAGWIGDLLYAGAD